MLAQLPNIYPSFDDKIPLIKEVETSIIPPPLNIKISTKTTKRVRKDIKEISFTGEYHVPGYQYLGPGTRYADRQRLGIVPINDLDRIAMYHDRGYAETAEAGTTSERVLGRSVHDLGAGAAMITYGLNPWSDAPLGWSLYSGSILLTQGVARVHPSTALGMALIDAVLY